MTNFLIKPGPNTAPHSCAPSWKVVVTEHDLVEIPLEWIMCPPKVFWREKTGRARHALVKIVTFFISYCFTGKILILPQFLLP